MALALWVLVTLAVWVACVGFTLALCRMSSDADRAAHELEARLYPDAARMTS